MGAQPENGGKVFLIRHFTVSNLTVPNFKSMLQFFARLEQALQGNSMRLQHLYKRVFAKALPTDGPTDGQTDRRTDGRTDGQTDTPSERDAKMHLKRMKERKRKRQKE